MKNLLIAKDIMRRELRMILTDPRLRSVVILAPFIYAILMSAVYWQGSVDEVPIAIVQHDHGKLSRTLIRMLDSSPKLRVASHKPSLQEAKTSLQNGDVYGIVVLEADFSSRVKQGKPAHLVTIVDASHLVLANTIANAVLQIGQTVSVAVSVDKLTRSGHIKSQALSTALPIRTDIRPLYNPEFSYSRFMIPGLLMTVLQQVILLGMALSWAGERETGTIHQLFQISRNPILLLLSKSVPYLVIYGLVAALFVILFFPASGIPIAGASLLLATYCVVFLIAVVSWGAWISVWVPNRLFATQILMFLAMPSFLLSGYTWPSIAMPTSLQTFAQILPLTHFIDGLRRLCLGAHDWSSLSGSILSLISLFAAHSLLAWLGLKYFIKYQKQAS